MNLFRFQQTHVTARIEQETNLQGEASGDNTHNLQLPSSHGIIIELHPVM
jgi:hypothetical protein